MSQACETNLESVITTPSEGSEISRCASEHCPDEENAEDHYENVECDCENREPNCELPDENLEHSSSSKNSVFDNLDQYSLAQSVDMEDQIGQLRNAVEQMRTSLSSKLESASTKLSVTFPIFRGDECEDVHEFLSNFKRAGRLNGWNGTNLVLGLPLYLRGYASAWFKTLQNPDEMSSDDLSDALTTHFASGASEWRIRQALGQRRQLEKEPVANYSYSLRTHCARLNLLRSEWTHYFVQGLKPEIAKM